LVSWLSGIHSRVTSAENHPGIGFPIQIPLLHKSHQQRIAASDNGSRILTNTWIVKLTQDDPGVPGSRVNGAIICEHKPGTSIIHYQVKAKLVILATGGFQGSPSMTAKYLGYGGDNIFVRSNRGSVGGSILSMAIYWQRLSEPRMPVHTIICLWLSIVSDTKLPG
jgi:hypothetical protein